MTQSTPKQFFEALWGEQTGYIDLRCIKLNEDPIERFWRYPEQLDAFLLDGQKYSGKYNVYYGVCLRSQKDGKATSIKQSALIWADFDWHHGEDKLNDTIAKVKGFPVRPMGGVLTGRGIQVFWKLKEITNNLMRIEQINRAIVAALGADIKSADIAHVLRVPGTININWSDRPMAKIHSLNSERTCMLVDFDFLPHPEQQVKSTPATKEQFLEIVQALSCCWIKGHRQYLAMYFSGWMAKEGYSEAQISNIIVDVCRMTNDEEINARLKNVKNTCYKIIDRGYRKVAGYQKFRETITDIDNEQSRNALVTLEKLLPREPSKDMEKEVNVKAKITKLEETLRIIKVEKYDSERPSYSVLFEDNKTIRKITWGVLTSWGSFRKAYGEVFNYIPQITITAKVWESYINELMKEVKVTQVPDEAAYLEGTIWNTIMEFVRSAPETLDPDRIKSGLILFRKNSHYVFKGSCLIDYLQSKRLKFKSTDLWQLIREKEGGRKPYQIKVDDKRKPYKLWYIPVEQLDQEIIDPNQDMETIDDNLLEGI